MKKVPKYIKDDIEEFIWKLSFPIKKTEHMKFEKQLRGSKSLFLIQKQYGWIKSRDGFADGFSISELKNARKKIQRELQARIMKKFIIPLPLKKLAHKVQELVYFRMLRGDARANLIFLMRPVLRSVAHHYNIHFDDMRNYSVYDLIQGTPKRYSPASTFLFYRGSMVIGNKPVICEKDVSYQDIHGAVAFKGRVRGPARIVTFVEDLKKVKNGDILVAQMTFPAFIIAMRKASAFITDEGGITSHAAIIAREMKKPCIIGTKIATRVLKDGDMVEVDANKGVVKKV